MDRNTLLCLKIFFILSFFILGACSKETSQEMIVFPNVAPGDCQGAAMTNQYLVRKKDGSLHVIFAKDRKEMLEKYVRPQINDLSFVEPNYKISLENTTFTSEVGPSASASPTWGADRIEASLGWNKGYRGQGVLVAVIDSGVEISHPALKNQVFINQIEKNGKPGVDDDGNGYIDDISGWDFARNVADNYDDVGHGTHVAGIIAAQPGVGTMSGVAPQSQILPLDFMTGSGGMTSDAIRAIEYAKKMGAQIINASWGSAFCSQLLKDEVASLKDANILFVAAAGNNSPGHDLSRQPEYPAAYGAETQITVGAITQNGIMAYFSNYGSPVDIMAPGASILSSYLRGGYAYMDGTSMATPFVAGFAAQLLSARPNLNALALKELVLQSVFLNNYLVKTHGEISMSAALSILPHF